MYNLEMLISLLENLELCHRVSLSGASTNLKSSRLSTEDEELDLFFPSLLNECRPSTLLCEKFTFGWCLICQDQQYQFFTSRFLHVLLLRLAGTFPLAHESKNLSSDCKESCSVWRNGISWDNAEGIRTVVEVVGNQSVLIAMACSDNSSGLEYSKHRSAVIKLVLDLKQQICPHIDTSEYLINQPFMSNWPAGEMSPSVDGDLLPMKNVCSSMLLHKPYIVTCKNIRSELTTEQILIFEPYLRLNFPFICDLMDSSKSDEPVPPHLLSGMKIDCSSLLHHVQVKRWSYSSLREYLDEMSLFAGKNLLDLAGLDIATVRNLREAALMTSASQNDDSTPSTNELVATSNKNSVDLSSLHEEPFDLNHLPQLLTALWQIVDWFNLGLQLGVHYSILRKVQIEQQTVEDRKREMLVKWLQLEDGNRCNKNSLKTALRNIRCNVIDNSTNTAELSTETALLSASNS